MSQGIDPDYAKIKAFAQSKGYTVVEDREKIGHDRLGIFWSPTQGLKEEKFGHLPGFGINEGQWADMAQHIRDGKSFAVKRVF
jgi:hypothetical protein